MVTARLPPALGEQAFSVLTLDSREMAVGDRLDEVLTAVPGVALFRRNSTASANPTTQGISLRSIAGSGAGRALVTLDGAPQNDPFGGWVIWAGLPPEIIAQADIVRGSGAGPYGAGALTGVVALIERDGGRGDRVAEASLGEFGYRRGALTFGSGRGPLRLFAAAAGAAGGGWIPVRSGRGAADTAVTHQDWSASARISAGDGGGPVAAARLSAYEERRQSGLRGASAQARGQSASLTLARAPEDDELGWRLQAWVRRSNLENSSVSVAPGRMLATPASDQYDTPATGYGVNAALRRASLDFSLEAGVDLRWAEGESRERFRFLSGVFTRGRVAGGETFVGGAYLEGAHRSGPWLLATGARIDHWRSSDARRVERDLATGLVTVDARTPDAEGLLPSGRAALRYQVSEALYLRAAVYAGFRPATLNELHRPFRVGNDVTEANAALEPERLYGVEAGVGGKLASTQWSVNLFVNRLDDAITNVTLGGPGTHPVAGVIPVGGVLRQRRNAGYIKASGVEAQVRAGMGDAVSISLLATYSLAEVNGGASAPQLTGLRPSQTPRIGLAFAADWAPAPDLTLSAALRYEGDRYDDDQNTRRLSPSLSADARIEWEMRPGAVLYVAADNVFDAKIETAETADGTESFDQPRRTRIGLRLRY